MLIAERHELPVLSIELVVKGGETLVPPGKEGALAAQGKSLEALAVARGISERPIQTVTSPGGAAAAFYYASRQAPTLARGLT